MKGGPDISILLSPRAPDERGFIQGVTDILAKARSGTVRAYLLVVLTELPDGATETTNTICCASESERLMLLGAVRRAEHRFVSREWDDG